MLEFYKFQGTGNDFVMIDNRRGIFNQENSDLVSFLCDRKLGIGGDGLILLETDNTFDFKMVYYNSDGKESTMCGNGGRCIVAFASLLGIIQKQCRFIAVDGEHQALINEDGDISLQMIDVENINKSADFMFLNTGSPHHIQVVQDIEYYDVFNNGKRIRESELYMPSGTNVNFVEQKGDNYFKIRTFERGVENETLSCGTGATAAAIAMFDVGKANARDIKIDVEGGSLKVSFDYSNQKYSNVFLTGPAEFVFQGKIAI